MVLKTRTVDEIKELQTKSKNKAEKRSGNEEQIDDRRNAFVDLKSKVQQRWENLDYYKNDN